MKRHSCSVSLRRRGFTLVELLIVIGIIAVLIGIIVPTVGKVRVSAQKVATQNTLNRLTQGIEAYYSEYNAYPGPFADEQLASSDTVTPASPSLLGPGNNTLLLQYATPGPTPSYAVLGATPTTSENLFLGLCGGLRVDVTNSRFVYDPDLARRGRGPQWLAQNNVGKRSQSYLEITDADISATDDNRNPLSDPSAKPSEWWAGGSKGPALTAPFKGDSAIYEFMDRFSKAKPILYLRAKRGVTRVAAEPLSGFIYDPNNPDRTSPYQYRPDQIETTYSNFTSRDKMADAIGKVWTVDKIDYPAVNDDVTPSKIKFNAGEERYFVNETASTGNPNSMGDPSKTLVPAYKDKYILISAGPDGLYGTADDIRN